MKALLLAMMLMSGLTQAQLLIAPLSGKQSLLTWEGRPVVGQGHTGTIAFKYGTITLSPSGEITKGEFVLDMHTLHNTDIDDKKAAQDLVEHLKSDDFFSVSSFPTASFVITEVVSALKFPQVNEYKVTGKLTIKGITHTISFPAIITKKDGAIIAASATVVIDRTLWQVNYQSGSVFALLKDGIIADEIIITLKLVFDGC